MFCYAHSDYFRIEQIDCPLCKLEAENKRLKAERQEAVFDAVQQSERDLVRENQKLKGELSAVLAETARLVMKYRRLRGRAKRVVNTMRGAGGIDFDASKALLSLAEELHEETENE